MSESPELLIVGIDSLIGKALFTVSKRGVPKVLGTTRRLATISAGMPVVYLDLGKLEDWQCPPTIKVAVFCAGITKIYECKNDPEQSYRINVTGISQLANKLLQQGVLVVYLSTNQVFDGLSPYPLPDDPVSPVSEYGKQKVEIEQQLRDWGKNFAIVRLTKVLGGDFPLFTNWVNTLKKGDIIRPFSNMMMAPVPLSSVISVLRLIIDRRSEGIFHISGDHDISYDEVARIGARTLGLNPDLIRPLTAAEAGYNEHIPPHTTLDTECLRESFGIEVTQVVWTIEQAFGEPQKLVGS